MKWDVEDSTLDTYSVRTFEIYSLKIIRLTGRIAKNDHTKNSAFIYRDDKSYFDLDTYSHVMA